MQRAMAIAAHPDDIEFLMAGTMMRLKEAGFELHYMNVANGCCGTTQYDSATIAEIRAREGRAAAEYLGAEFHPSICDDLNIFYDKPTLAKVASVVRRVAPQIVLTHSPVDYMEDHTNTCRLAVTAAFARGMPNFPVDPPRPATEQNVTVYHAQPYSNHDPLGQPVRPSLFVDVSDLLERKQEMLALHRSQKQWLDESQGHDSYLRVLESLDREVGAFSERFELAEGWRRHLHLGFCGPDDDPLATTLAAHVHHAGCLERH